ncbi:MAG TPA: SidE phosphodiesterase domain-containing protein [Chlamydiales bacterium]|nr:SidE phosphodiesterase domain-containing protein [Chlamydiales bacterium]
MSLDSLSAGMGCDSSLVRLSQPLALCESDMISGFPFQIDGNPAHGRGPTIPISIGDIQHIGQLSETNFGEMCKTINEITLTATYPNGFSRANHNGTHSARQARMLEILLEMMGDRAYPLSDDEKMHLKLATYLLRSGRIDESSHHLPNPDDYNTRSAMIYEAYANQCIVDKKIVEDFAFLIANSCKPKGIRDEEIDQNPKYLFLWNCLCIVHELDLIRCYSQSKIDGSIKIKVQDHLADLGIEASAAMMEKLFDVSKKLCSATGCSRYYDEDPGDDERFSFYSQHGDACWERLQSVGIYRDSFDLKML